MRIKVYDNAEKLFGAAAETVGKLMRTELDDENGGTKKIRVCLSADSANLGMQKELLYEDVSWRDVSLYPSWEFLNENSLSPLSRRKKIDDVLISKLTTFDREKNGTIFEGSFTLQSIEKANRLISSDSANGTELLNVLCADIMPYGSLLINLPLTDCFECRNAYRESEDLLGSAVATLSPYAVMKTKHVLMLASGIKMASWVAYLLTAEFSRKCPAALLKEHPDFILLLDKEAASLVPQCYL